jgi:hypothetical protein
LNELLPIFLNNLLPIFLAAGAGYALSRFTELDPRPLSRLALYIFSPCLIFTLITQSKLTNDDMLRMVVFATAIVFLVGALTLLLTKLFRFERRVTAAILLTSMFMNAGNFGLPVVLFAFGEAALSHASLFFVTEATLVYTLGVVVASMGSVNIRQALGNLFKIPNLYAVLLALVFLYTGMEVPIPLARTTKLLGDASIPVLLILLGLQFKSAGWSGKLVPLAVTGTMRLAVSPLIAWLLSWSLGVGGVVRQATVLQAAMPAAVLNIVLATEFDAEPSLVTAAVFLTTLLSPFTLTPILAYLGA